MNKDEITQRIEGLIRSYEELKSQNRIKGTNEEATKQHFILPLFEAIGWNVRDINEVYPEEHVKNQGRADYAFKLNGRTQFFLEAKALGADLDDDRWAKQAINYSWNKGVTYAVLTDFESIKIFNAQRIEKADLIDKLILEIPYTEYLENLEELQLLSKESFVRGELDAYSEKYGKKDKRVSIVTTKLYEDLNECREILSEELGACNSTESRDDLDEGVQKLLDRLIFLRVAEDRKIEEPTLLPMINEWKASKGKETLFESMVRKFRELDEIYNSNLFSPHPFEKWEDYADATEKVVKVLYGKHGYYEYDFSVMPADVLGTVYENYLGHRLSQSKKGLTVDKDAKKRKEQGIYYTPSYIVDYIVRNALGPVLKQCKSINDLQKIKVLDPACGSGSFLIKALEVITEKYKDFGVTTDENLKLSIIINNLYGVDLDSQAVEITRLNLLVSALEERRKLPDLIKNIKNGNSLTFDWHGEFPEVFKQEGFDVIIGNPPYIKEFVSKEAFDDLHKSPYYQGKMDLWTMFGCISIDLLKNDGVMGFIAPNNWISNAGASIFRDKVLNDGELKTFIDFGDYKVFEQAGIQTMIYIFDKKKPSKKYTIEYLRIIDKNITEDKLIGAILGEKAKIDIEPEKLIGKNISFSTTETTPIFDKLREKGNFELGENEVGQGMSQPQISIFLKMT